jgi:phosphopantetheine--protein transferase-like protein
MKILTGIDLVDISDFKKSLKNGGDNFLRRVFLPLEMKNMNIEHLAGIFAAKEAVTKALSLKPGEWLEIEIKNAPNGRPIVNLTKKLTSFDLSISHTEKVVIAVFVAIV